MFSINILMQLSRYLVSNRIHILANEAGHVTEYKPVYHRNVNVYRGINNTLEFRLKNADQKPLAVDDYTIHFVAFDQERRQVLKYSSNNNSGDITKLAPTGLFSVNIRENDLLNINQQYLSYTIYLEDAERRQTITYTDEWFGAEGTILISTAAFPGPVVAQTVEFFTTEVGPEGWWTTSAVDAEPALNGNEALHTAAIYANGYVGTVRVQATLENQLLGEHLTWTDVAEVPLNNNTTPVPVNFNGVFTYVRFVADADPRNKITKILVRN
jgi:hypothetical protein